jgi:hypothetical protein
VGIPNGRMIGFVWNYLRNPFFRDFLGFLKNTNVSLSEIMIPEKKNNALVNNFRKYALSKNKM